VTAAELLADLTCQGFRLTREDDGISVRPASRLTGELRQAIRTHRPALLALLAVPARTAPVFCWDQAEAERLLAQMGEALARVDRAVAAGKAPTARADAIRTLRDVAEGYVSGREQEAARGWDALELLRGAAQRALRLAAGERPPPFTYTPEEEAQLCRWLESYCGWPAGSAALWDPPGRPDPS
jgi:TubC N-terminal docking domain